MANKVLERTLNNVNKDDLRAGYAAPAGVDQFGNPRFAPPGSGVATETMSISGSARAALVLFAIIAVVGGWAWISIPDSAYGPVLIVSVLAGLGLGLATTFKPNVARVTAPLYAVAEGVALGMISRVYEDAYTGIVPQALLATGAIAFVMYTLYSTRIIKVTPRFQRILFAAVGAAMLFYMVNLVMYAFGSRGFLINDTGPMGIAVSVILIVIAAMTLATDFDFIERGAQAGLPKYMDWAAAYGLVVSIVWIYLEVLRLLAKSRN
jgi:uncharacterized YccA/Bax inhibitor family protein